jgi:hypothetical protein
MTSGAPARRPPADWPRRCGFSSRGQPLSSLMPYERQHTALAQTQPSPILLTLFTSAPQVKQYKERMLLHLPSSCPAQVLRQRVTPLLYVVPAPVCHTS